MESRAAAGRHLRGKWWEMFGDPQLNALEEQVSTSNQNIAAAAANYLAARAMVKQARAQYYPTVAAAPTIINSRQPIFGAAVTGTGSTGSSGSTGFSGSTGTPVFGTGTFTEYCCRLTRPGSRISGAGCETPCAPIRGGAGQRRGSWKTCG